MLGQHCVLPTCPQPLWQILRNSKNDGDIKRYYSNLEIGRDKLSRIKKEPDVRISELLKAAEELFIAQGYEKTLVSEIVKKVGVSQGAFYYYFKSKEAILEEIVSHDFIDIESRIAVINSNDDKSIQKKIMLYFNLMREKAEERMPLFKSLYNENQCHLLDLIWRKMHLTTGPILTGLLLEGNRKGVLKVKYPEIAVDFLIPIFKRGVLSQFQDPKISEKIFSLAMDLSEFILGVPREEFLCGALKP